MIELFSQPWPWYVAGPLTGLVVPMLLLVGGRMFGVSENMRHICAAAIPGKISFFNYDWKSAGGWNLTMIFGAMIGGFIAATWLGNPDSIAISEATRGDLAQLGITNFDGLVPESIFSWTGLTSLKGVLLIVVGGFFIGFGSRYAGGCTSGHAIMGLGNLQLPSLIAVLGFFAGGLFMTHVLFPFIF
ncbi:MAG: YeeE/YedE thiosulfate transporter family protein [Bacteroidetes bacterium]|nr:YeeE/YedE thiosulfate transporter family protein [Bacteroidota bacterium]